MRTVLGWTLLLACLCILAGAARAEEQEYVDETVTTPGDLTGWRLCPTCERLNPPEADYCVYCGAAFEIKTAEPYRRTPFAISLEMPFSAQDGLFIAGAGCAYDGGSWGDEFILTPLFIFIPLGAFNDLHIYVRQGPLRPFVSVIAGGYDLPEFEGGSPDDFFVTAGAAGGVRYNYDDRGSYLYGSGGVGFRRRGGEPYDEREGPVAIYKTRFGLFFTKHIAVTGSLLGWNAEVIATGGVAFAL
jgi:hypothetical protein